MRIKFNSLSDTKNGFNLKSRRRKLDPSPTVSHPRTWIYREMRGINTDLAITPITLNNLKFGILQILLK